MTSVTNGYGGRSRSGLPGTFEDSETPSGDGAAVSGMALVSAAFYRAYKTVEHLRQASATDPETDKICSDDITGPLATRIEYLNSPDGREILRIWTQFFESTFEDIDAFKSELDLRVEFLASDWELATESLEISLNSLARKIQTRLSRAA